MKNDLKKKHWQQVADAFLQCFLFKVYDLCSKVNDIMEKLIVSIVRRV